MTLNCAGCGAPLFPSDVQCTYCLRSTGYVGYKRLDVTQLIDREPKFIEIETVDPSGVVQTRRVLAPPRKP